MSDGQYFFLAEGHWNLVRVSSLFRFGTISFLMNVLQYIYIFVYIMYIHI